MTRVFGAVLRFFSAVPLESKYVQLLAAPIFLAVLVGGGVLSFRHCGLNTQGELAAKSALQDPILQQASVVTLCWTLQFVRPLDRERLIRRIYEALVEGGVLIITEKVLTNTQEMNHLFIELYYAFKRRNGYSETEIGRAHV